MRIGCLGAAKITPQALIWPAKLRGGVVLQAVAARDPARAQAFATTHDFVRAAPDYDALVNAADVDLVYNALPINLHAQWSIRALEAGKHVLCEKPFAMNAGEARQVLDAAKSSGKRVIEAFHYRYHPNFQQMLDLIAAGAIGEITGLTANFNVPIKDRDGQEIRHLPETGGGSFMDLGCYPLSWVLMVMRRAPETVAAEAVLTARGVDESLTTRLDFGDGVVANLSTSMALDAGFSAKLTIAGTRGAIAFVNPLAPQLGASLSVISGERTTPITISPIATYAYQLDAILTGLNTGEALPTEGEVILRQQETLDRVYEAADLRRLRYWTA